MPPVPSVFSRIWAEAVAWASGHVMTYPVVTSAGTVCSTNPVPSLSRIRNVPRSKAAVFPMITSLPAPTSKSILRNECSLTSSVPELMSTPPVVPLMSTAVPVTTIPPAVFVVASRVIAPDAVSNTFASLNVSAGATSPVPCIPVPISPRTTSLSAMPAVGSGMILVNVRGALSP